MTEDDPLVDLMALSDRDFRLGMAFYHWGRIHGREDEQREQREREYAAWQQAVRTVHAAAEMPERDYAADERRAERSRQWWAERRGENVA